MKNKYYRWEISDELGTLGCATTAKAARSFARQKEGREVRPLARMAVVLPPDGTFWVHKKMGGGLIRHYSI